MRTDEVAALVKWIIEVLKVSIITNWLAHFLSLLTIVTFTLVSLYTSGEGVTTARIFTVVATIELISMPLLNLGQKIGSLVTAWASLKRIEEFLMMEERTEVEENAVEGHHVRLSGATFGIRDKATLLHDLDVGIDGNKVWMITGRVGCVSVHFSPCLSSATFHPVGSVGLIPLG
jgi:ABC-type multidrug transport system fused ATPase/permease subunit